MCLKFPSFIDDLSLNKVADQSSTADGILYYASNAVDRNIHTCMRTRDVGQSTESAKDYMWWKVDLGGVYNIYSIHIIFKNYTGYGMHLKNIVLHLYSFL